MIGKAANVVMVVILLAAACNLVPAQQLPATTLTIDLGNMVEYQEDIYDPVKFARSPNVTPSLGIGAGVANFAVATLLGDIVAVNGQPAKGLYAGRSRTIGTRTNPTPGQAIADVTRAAIREHIFEILQSDGTPVGSIMLMGLSGGNSPPPGQPSTENANWAIVGGTGAFLGARGQAEAIVGIGLGGRAASMGEDPANRRINGGSMGQCVLHIIPMTAPQIVTTANGPAITHSDFSLVNGAKPAAAGEVLSLFATGLGPVRGIATGQTFPSNPPAPVNSPIQVIVNGSPAEVLAAVGYPGSVDGYQVNFRVPSGTAKGLATIQVSAAWITGTPVSIVVQ
ncbi:MAG: hypothetical protein JO307_32470 [Bryobacterales bacterium]|nr:hypothetical protein [Bryobacterales bacterium]MBV9397283.1 hypothetical protein [Bryobacterales bacterium]